MNRFKINTPQILVLCQLFYPELVSTGQTLTELCEELINLGVDVEVVCGPPTVLNKTDKVPRYLNHNGIKIKRVWGTRFSKLNFFGKLTNQITFALGVLFYLLLNFSKRPILILTNPPFLALLCSLFRIINGNEYIYLIFDVYPDTAIKLGVLREKSLLSKIWETCNTLILKHASIVIVLGRCMKKVILNKGSGIYDLADKIHMIPIWSDDRRIRPVSKKSNPYIKKWNLDGKFVVSYSGNLGRFHDIETIMESAKILKNFHDIQFLFIGEGYKKKWAVEFAKRWQLSNCQFQTYVDRENFGSSLACADVGLVSLLKEQEGLSVPSKTFGIMSAGVPVIAVMSSSSEIARVLIEQQCGIVIEPGKADDLSEAILDLYHNREKIKIMGNLARKAIDNKYSLQEATKSYYKLISNLN